MHIVILGTGETISRFNKETHKDSIIWAVGSAKEGLDSVNVSVDLWFCMHPGENIPDKSCMIQKNYPLSEIMEKYNTRFFTNSIAYMIAYALYIGATQISIYGVDLIATEYRFERPCNLYWIGVAKAMGVQVYNSAGLDNPIFLYGYDQDVHQKLIALLEYRLANTYKLIDAYRSKDYGLNTEKVIDQYIGRLSELKYLLDEIRG